MKRAVIFGAGGTGRRVFEMIKTDFDVIAFVDNDKSKVGTHIKDYSVKEDKKEGG